MDESSTLMAAVPAEGWNEAIVAKVEVVELLPDPFNPAGGSNFRRVRAKVVEAFKGVRIGEMLTISTGLSSCSQRIDGAAWRAASADKRQHYIAGTMLPHNGETVFVGAWIIDWKNSSPAGTWRHKKLGHDLPPPLIMHGTYSILPP